MPLEVAIIVVEVGKPVDVKAVDIAFQRNAVAKTKVTFEVVVSGPDIDRKRMSFRSHLFQQFEVLNEVDFVGPSVVFFL